jgi:PAS domain S-box-containing protein
VEKINELLASAMLVLPEAVLLTATRPGRGTIVFANECFQRLTGYSMQEIAGRDLTLLQGPETDVSVLQDLSGADCGEVIRPCELLLYKKGGSPFWDRVRSQRITSSEQEVYCLQVHSEISRFRDVESTFVPSQDREAARAGAGEIIHDFNNLFTAIMVYSGLLNSKVCNDHQLQRYTEEITAAAQRGSQRVAQLLNLEHSETDQPGIHNPKKSTLLLVEDEELVRRSVEAALSMRGYKILPAANAAEATSISQNYSGKIELMVTDLGLPVISGLELAQQIRRARPDMKVLFVSGSGDDPGMKELSPGREDFFRKPFTPAALVHKIEELLNRHPDE